MPFQRTPGPEVIVVYRGRKICGPCALREGVVREAGGGVLTPMVPPRLVRIYERTVTLV